MRVLILGAGTRTAHDDYPIWLAEHDGKILLERFVEACSALNTELVFAVREQDVRAYHIDSVIRIAAPTASVICISGETLGAACTALLCAPAIKEEEELLILNSNEFLDIDYKNIVDSFRERNLDGGVVCFRSVHPRYSYVLLGEDGLIVQSSEKRPISRHATAGFYWFRRGGDFIVAAQDMIRKDAHVDGKFFISLTFNELILKDKRLGLTETDSRNYKPLKSRQQITAYESGSGSEG